MLGNVFGTLCPIKKTGNKKGASSSHHTATTSYPCCLPTLGSFRGSWSYETYPSTKVRICVELARVE